MLLGQRFKKGVIRHYVISVNLFFFFFLLIQSFTFTSKQNSFADLRFLHLVWSLKGSLTQGNSGTACRMVEPASLFRICLLSLD